MDANQGAALRFQLDGLLGSLTQVDQMAGVRDDRAVLQLVARLHEAREAAVEIETREQEKEHKPARRGVVLVRTLQEREG